MGLGDDLGQQLDERHRAVPVVRRGYARRPRRLADEPHERLPQTHVVAGLALEVGIPMSDGRRDFSGRGKIPTAADKAESLAREIEVREGGGSRKHGSQKN